MIFLTGLIMFAQIQAAEPKVGVAGNISLASNVLAASAASISPVATSIHAASSNAKKIPLVIYEVNFDGLNRHVKALVHHSNKKQVAQIAANANVNKIACTAAIHISGHIAKNDFVLKLGKPNPFYFEGMPDGSIEHIHHDSLYSDFASYDLATITTPCDHAPLVFKPDSSTEKNDKVDQKS